VDLEAAVGVAKTVVLVAVSQEVAIILNTAKTRQFIILLRQEILFPTVLMAKVALLT
jgi:hypothetical protein